MSVKHKKHSLVHSACNRNAGGPFRKTILNMGEEWILALCMQCINTVKERYYTCIT